MNARALAAELVGTAALLAIVVGSGIMGERLAAGNEAIALLANSLATAGGLFVLIAAFAPVSGAHFNPAVSVLEALDGSISWMDAGRRSAVQMLGAGAGVWIAHAMFALPLLQQSSKVRWGAALWLAEGVATFGLVCTIRLCARHGTIVVAAAVASYIGAAYWFTASTSFANPAVTVARSLTDTFAGIAPSGIAPFIVAQLAGGFGAWAFCRWLSK